MPGTRSGAGPSYRSTSIIAVAAFRRPLGIPACRFGKIGCAYDAQMARDSPNERSRIVRLPPARGVVE
jgi:hypothetical protein